MRKLTIFLGLLLLFSCGEDTLPKPKTFLSLEYTEASYSDLSLKRPYTFKAPENLELLTKFGK